MTTEAMGREERLSQLRDLRRCSEGVARRNAEAEVKRLRAALVEARDALRWIARRLHGPEPGRKHSSIPWERGRGLVGLFRRAVRWLTKKPE